MGGISQRVAKRYLHQRIRSAVGDQLPNPMLWVPELREHAHKRQVSRSTVESYAETGGPSQNTKLQEVARRILQQADKDADHPSGKSPITSTKSMKQIGKHEIASRRFETDGGHLEVYEDSPYAQGDHSVFTFLVDEDRRGQGIGSRLVDEMLKTYPDHPISAQVSSLASLKVFLNKGFEADGTRDFDQLQQKFEDNGGSLRLRRELRDKT